ncbi:hypothetical protein [Nocardia sp. A7]|uniref:hypothetical protein n=1 Tax=Nocardia sp. A7 TaxID=2789274 RepID=UPI00397AF2BE
MHGFAIVDRQPVADASAIWQTTRTENLVRHTNAVIIEHNDPEYDVQVRSLTANRCVVLTQGTEPPPKLAHAQHIEYLDDFIDRITAHQGRILEAIADYSPREKTKLISPRFTPVPVLAAPEADEPRCRALAVDNYVCAVWTTWLSAEEQRVRRPVSPKTGKSPWIMTPDLNSRTIAEFPAGFAEGMNPNPR